MTDPKPPDESDDDEETSEEFERFEALTKKLLDTKPRLAAAMQSGDVVPSHHFEMTCPGCGKTVAIDISISGIDFDAAVSPFEVQLQPDSRYLIECFGTVEHVCDYGRGGGGDPVPAHPLDRPPSLTLSATRDRDDEAKE